MLKMRKQEFMSNEHSLQPVSLYIFLILYVFTFFFNRAVVGKMLNIQFEPFAESFMKEDDSFAFSVFLLFCSSELCMANP